MCCHIIISPNIKIRNSRGNIGFIFVFGLQSRLLAASTLYFPFRDSWVKGFVSIFWDVQ